MLTLKNCSVNRRFKISWLSFILLWIIIFLFVDLGIYCCKYVKEHLLSKHIQDTSDYRSFVCGEIVWYSGTKYKVHSYKWHSDDLRIILELSFLDSNHLFNVTGVDSVYVKKVERVYAELGSKL